MLPPSNLRAITPRLSFIDPTVSAADRARAIDLVRAAERALLRGEAGTALALAEQGGTLLPRTAWPHGVRCRSLAALGREAEAREAQLRAESLDLLPLAPTATLRAALRELAVAQEAWVFDADAHLRPLDSAAWSARFVDYVHPSIEGQIDFAHGIAEELRARGWPQPAAAWSQDYRPAEEHLARGSAESVRVAGIAAAMRLHYVIDAGAPRDALLASELALREALAHAPDDAQVLFALGLAELILGNGTEGTAALRRSLAEDPAIRDVARALAERSPIVRAALGQLLESPPRAP